MAVSNIEKFDDITGKIFAELYQSFPLPQALLAEDFVEKAVQFDEQVGTEVPTDETEFFIATATWLMQAGYITCKTYPYVGIDNAVLTAKGLEVLKATPESVSSKSTIGEQLAVSAKEGGKEVARGLVSEAFGLGVKILSPMIGLS
ncbi:hypothetical protein KVG88_12265 [Pseudomonas sp. SWRI74]|uniref:DUF2513 domain-containing protein n=1 Tax=Pseudomonas azerbaijanoccidentalis TaxID=2842347 RepID=A0ABS6QPI3_9PSED|nr:hypothetical protein [Pseudomonas azerbaijanoccidentalis]MBV4520841.1 hypothetical protein [Pseudomonas azerbaijanoccidentalis]